jgi:hypothetical protein
MKTFPTKPQGGNQLHETESTLRNLAIAQPVQILWNSNIRHKSPFLKPIANQLSPFHTHPTFSLVLDIQFEKL